MLASTLGETFPKFCGFISCIRLAKCFVKVRPLENGMRSVYHIEVDQCDQLNQVATAQGLLLV